MSGRPLQNRVTPFGELVATTARGTLFGNRGGRFHKGAEELGQRRHASRQWICCQLQFKQRQRAGWQTGYTELFFLDEVTAFAAGHRPCFECRRADAERFAANWQQASAALRRPRAPEMDVVLDAERREGRAKRRHIAMLETLPDGAMIAEGDAALAVRGHSLLPWTPAGYLAPRPRPGCGTVVLLTPPTTVAVLRAGYRPAWHESAGLSNSTSS
jgi:hypothetical protein